MSYLLKNFLRGLLLLVPMAAAIYVVVYLYNFLDNLIPRKVFKNIFYIFYGIKAIIRRVNSI